MKTLFNPISRESCSIGKCRSVLTFTVICLLGTIAAGYFSASSFGGNVQTPADRLVIGIQYDGPIRVVYQISRDDLKGDIGAGLYYLRKLHESYITAGVDPKRLDIRAVFHGDVAVHLLTDAAWNRWRSETAGNPNGKVIEELARRGVSLELCDSRRRSNGWSKADVHPDVLLVRSAYQRLIDLQQRGYAYIRF